jgi:hypothetical protein
LRCDELGQARPKTRLREPDFALHETPLALHKRLAHLGIRVGTSVSNQAPTRAFPEIRQVTDLPRSPFHTCGRHLAGFCRDAEVCDAPETQVVDALLGLQVAGAPELAATRRAEARRAAAKQEISEQEKRAALCAECAERSGLEMGGAKVRVLRRMSVERRASPDGAGARTRMMSCCDGWKCLCLQDWCDYAKRARSA